MKCKKTRNWLPLFVGGDLGEMKSSQVKSHLRNCPLCQQEYHKYQHSLEKTKAWIKNETMDWSQIEWQDCLNSAVKEKTPKSKIFIPLSFKPSWAVGLMLIIAIALSIFIMNPSLVTKDNTEIFASALDTEDFQKEVELVLVSQETGLQVKWIFNKEFNLKEEIK
ncbi:MAG: hypothetical protein GF421_06590 [Candidatus Aminicenantes bacterium]|nr:hypothetical protein [Candidatus Aminicenantes bacterium]